MVLLLTLFVVNEVIDNRNSSLYIIFITFCLKVLLLFVLSRIVAGFICGERLYIIWWLTKGIRICVVNDAPSIHW